VIGKFLSLGKGHYGKSRNLMQLGKKAIPRLLKLEEGALRVGGGTGGIPKKKKGI